MKVNLSDVYKNIPYTKTDDRFKAFQYKTKKLNWILERIESKFGFLLYVTYKEGILFYSLVSDSITRNKFVYFINILKEQSLIEQVEASSILKKEVSEVYSDYVANKMKYYRLTNLGMSLVKLEVIFDYLEQKYKKIYNEDVRGA